MARFGEPGLAASGGAVAGFTDGELGVVLALALGCLFCAGAFFPFYFTWALLERSGAVGEGKRGRDSPTYWKNRWFRWWFPFAMRKSICLLSWRLYGNKAIPILYLNFYWWTMVLRMGDQLFCGGSWQKSWSPIRRTIVHQ